MGRLTKDVELRRTGSGTAVANFTLAVERDFSKDKETDFIECVAWCKNGEFAEKYFSKGKMAIVAGRLQIRKWEDKNGNKRSTAEVVAENIYFGDSKTSDNKFEAMHSKELEPDYPAIYGDDPGLPF
jgi:single-strand DNA-binding protein